ncbi:hypothetical protein HYT26_01495 [Candidatus Pacearchaeota archaeon]|nr:hypothetical protein [Candidatus Pacearchaeota archaeon]
MNYRKKIRRDRLCNDIFGRSGFSKTITAMILILAGVLGIAVVEVNKHVSYLHSRAGIYEIAEWFGFSESQVDKLVEGARNRINDPSWK